MNLIPEKAAELRMRCLDLACRLHEPRASYSSMGTFPSGAPSQPSAETVIGSADKLFAFVTDAPKAPAKPQRRK